MSSLDMALGDLITKNRTPSARGGSRGGARGGRGGRGGAAAQSESGPMRKPRTSGQQQQQQQQRTPYQRAPQQQQQQAYAPQAIQYAPQPISLQYAPSNAAGGKWTHDLYQSPEPQQQPQPTKKLQGDTVHVSNLASDVTDEDVREIFERIGTVKVCTVNYDRSGVSTGTATVVFGRFSDAEKAVADYDEAEVDGRIMKLKLVGSIVTAPVVVKKKQPVVVVQQQQPLAYVQQPIQFQQAPIQYQQPTYQQQQRPVKAVVSRGAAKVARGGRGGASSAPTRGGATRGGAASGRGGRGGFAAKTAATSEDLDAEMDSYHKVAPAAAAAAAPTPAAAGQPTTV